MEMSQNVVSVDGCHMKHPRYTGQLLLVTGRDGDMKNFTVAWALALAENEDNYTFLFEAMKENEGVKGWMDRMQTVIISDRCKGLGNAIRSCFKNATPVHCGRHLYMNVKALGGAPPKRGATRIEKLVPEATCLIWKLIKAPAKIDSGAAMDQLRIVNRGARQFCPLTLSSNLVAKILFDTVFRDNCRTSAFPPLLVLPSGAAEYLERACPERWALHLLHGAGHVLQGHSTSNFGESENARLLRPARYLAPFDFIQQMVRTDMATRCERKLEAEAWAKKGLKISPKGSEVYQEQVKC